MRHEDGHGNDPARTGSKTTDLPAVLILGATGAVPATLALFALYGPVGEIAVWTALALAVWLPVSIKRGIRRRVRHMTLVGAMAGLVTGVVQASFAHALFANDPAVAAQYGGAATLAVRGQVLGIDIVIGIVWGLLVGLTWAGTHLAGRRILRRGSTDA